MGIGYCSIHTFKGLESNVVILTDIDNITGSLNESLLYVGLSRAKFKLIILLHENCRTKIKKILKNAIN